MRRTRVKICGITRSEDALAAETAGCDAVGVVFWPGSKRCVSATTAREITDALSPLVEVVGVFVDAGPETVARYMQASGISTAQLCGELPAGPWAPLLRTVRLIRSIGVVTGPVSLTLRVDGIGDYLLDTAKAGVPGGTGETFDWSLAEPVRAWGRIWLAGGLDPSNVSDAIRAVRPYAVDVSTGVEDSPGVKSTEKIAAFIAAVGEADTAVQG